MSKLDEFVRTHVKTPAQMSRVVEAVKQFKATALKARCVVCDGPHKVITLVRTADFARRGLPPPPAGDDALYFYGLCGQHQHDDKAIAAAIGDAWARGCFHRAM